jgi:hypothetical protein
MPAEWGSFLETGHVTVKVKGRVRTESVHAWRDTPGGPVSPSLERAGANHVAARIRDLTIVGSRPTVPPPCHTETPSA